MESTSTWGFVKLKKIQKSEKNSEVGGWVKPQLGFLFFWEILCFFVFFVLFSCFKMFKKKKKLDNGVGGWCLTNTSFLRFFDFFNLTRPLYSLLYLIIYRTLTNFNDENEWMGLYATFVHI